MSIEIEKIIWFSVVICVYRFYCEALLTHTQHLHSPLYRYSSQSSRSVYRCWTGTMCASSRTVRRDRGRYARLLPHHMSSLRNRNYPPLTAHFSYVISTPSLRLHLLSFLHSFPPHTYIPFLSFLWFLPCPPTYLHSSQHVCADPSLCLPPSPINPTPFFDNLQSLTLPSLQSQWCTSSAATPSDLHDGGLRPW